MTNAKSRAFGFLLTQAHIEEMFTEQQGRCFYSGIRMRLDPEGPWRMSLERKDNDGDYEPENCVLIAVEFNTSDWSRCKNATKVNGTAQWSREKVQEVPALRQKPVDLNTLRELIDEEAKAPDTHGGWSPRRHVNGMGDPLQAL